MNTVADYISELKSNLFTLKPITPEEFTAQQAERYNAKPGNLNIDDGYNCDECKNRGDFARVGDGGYIVTYPCSCMAIRRCIKRMNQSNMKSLLDCFKFDNFIADEPWQKHIKQRAIAFCDEAPGSWLFIGGQVGCGKTHLCSAICADLMYRGKAVMYMVWTEVSKLLKSLVTDSAYAEQIRPYKEAPILYIDDFLKTRAGDAPTSGDINLAFEIINSRLNDTGKTTVISSEKTIHELMRFDEATMSRIYQKASKGGYLLSVDRAPGRNYRLR